MAVAPMTGKVAVVTAASRGIGRAVALTLGGRGASVVVNYHGNAAKAQEVVDAIADAGGAAVAVQGSVSNRADVVRLFDAATESFGGVDVAVNMAGQFIEKPIVEITDNDGPSPPSRRATSGRESHCAIRFGRFPRTRA